MFVVDPWIFPIMSTQSDWAGLVDQREPNFTLVAREGRSIKLLDVFPQHLADRFAPVYGLLRQPSNLFRPASPRSRL